MLFERSEGVPFPRTNKYKCFHENVTRKRAPQKPRRSTTTRGRVAVTVLDFACALLVKNTYAYHPKNGILMSFTVAISFDTLCLPVFVNLKQATPNSSKLGLLIQPLTQRAPQRSPTHVFLLSINWYIHCLCPNTWLNHKFGRIPRRFTVL